MAVRQALASDGSDVAAAVLPVPAAGAARSGATDVGTSQAAGAGARRRAVKYRSLAGDGFYDAVVLSDRPDGGVDLEISLPGTFTSLFYTRARLAPDRESCQFGQCYPSP